MSIKKKICVFVISQLMSGFLTKGVKGTVHPEIKNSVIYSPSGLNLYNVSGSDEHRERSMVSSVFHRPYFGGLPKAHSKSHRLWSDETISPKKKWSKVP